jgi:D-glycero-D-manno-heptose 1,7-bisphosphate phosphatase
VRSGWVAAPGRGPLVLEADRRADARDARPAVFLDRDGVLNELTRDPVSGDPESPLKVGDVRLIAGAAAAVHELARAGFVLVCVSNQPAAAKRKATVEQLQAVHERVLDLLTRQRAHVDASRLCPHHPDGAAPALSGPCCCRKPRPGMLLDAAARLDLDLDASWIVGDTDADVAAGHAAGCRTVLLEYPGSARKRSHDARPELRAADLRCAAALLLRERF